MNMYEYECMNKRVFMSVLGLLRTPDNYNNEVATLFIV